MQARADHWSYRTSKFVRRHALAVSLATFALLLLVGFTAYSSVQSARIARERDRAVRAEAETQLQADRARAEAATAREVSDFLVGLFDPEAVRSRHARSWKRVPRASTASSPTSRSCARVSCIPSAR